MRKIACLRFIRADPTDIRNWYSLWTLQSGNPDKPEGEKRSRRILRTTAWRIASFILCARVWSAPLIWLRAFVVCPNERDKQARPIGMYICTVTHTAQFPWLYKSYPNTKEIVEQLRPNYRVISVHFDPPTPPSDLCAEKWIFTGSNKLSQWLIIANWASPVLYLIDSCHRESIFTWSRCGNCSISLSSSATQFLSDPHI